VFIGGAMGLDMYLYKETYYSRYNDNREVVTVGGENIRTVIYDIKGGDVLA